MGDYSSTHASLLGYPKQKWKGIPNVCLDYILINKANQERSFGYYTGGLIILQNVALKKLK